MTVEQQVMENQGQDTPPAAAAVTTTAATPAVSTVVDVDAAELSAARAAIEGGDKPTTEPTGQQPEGEAAADASELPGPAGQQAAPAQEQGGPPRMIPYQRFAEKAAEVRELRERAIYLEGQNEALQKARAANPPQQTTEPAQQQPSIDEQVQALEKQLLDNAEKFDNAEMTLRAFKESEFNIGRQIAVLRAHQATTQPQQQRPQTALADQQLLERQAERLAAEHPYLARFATTGGAHLDALKQAAYKHAELQGRPIIPDGSAASNYRLREMCAQVADVLGPLYFPDVVQPSPAGAPGQKRTAQQQQTLDKLSVAEGMAPDINGIGSKGGSGDVLTEDRVAAMSDEQILALPASVRAKFNGRQT